MRKFIDLSHEIADGMVSNKGIPGPVISNYLGREASGKSYDGGTTFHIGRIDMVANTGTYIDCPFHRYADGKDLSETALERFAHLPGVVVRLPHRERIALDRSDFHGIDVAGKAVLVHTGWSARWGISEYFDNHS